MTKSDSAYEAREQLWLKHLKEATASGETLTSYAKTQGLKLADVYRWKGRLTTRGVWPRAAKVPAFVPATISTPTSPPTRCAVLFPNGVRLEFSGAFDSAQLQTLFASIGTLA